VPLALQAFQSPRSHMDWHDQTANALMASPWYHGKKASRSPGMWLLFAPWLTRISMLQPGMPARQQNWQLFVKLINILPWRRLTSSSLSLLNLWAQWTLRHTRFWPSLDERFQTFLATIVRPATLSVPADICSNTALQRYIAAWELYWREPPGSLAIGSLIINFFLPREHLPRVKKIIIIITLQLVHHCT